MAKRVSKKELEKQKERLRKHDTKLIGRGIAGIVEKVDSRYSERNCVS